MGNYFPFPPPPNTDVTNIIYKQLPYLSTRWAVLVQPFLMIRMGVRGINFQIYNYLSAFSLCLAVQVLSVEIWNGRVPDIKANTKFDLHLSTGKSFQNTFRRKMGGPQRHSWQWRNVYFYKTTLLISNPAIRYEPESVIYSRLIDLIFTEKVPSPSWSSKWEFLRRLSLKNSVFIPCFN